MEILFFKDLGANPLTLRSSTKSTDGKASRPEMKETHLLTLTLLLERREPAGTISGVWKCWWTTFLQAHSHLPVKEPTGTIFGALPVACQSRRVSSAYTTT